ncbi:MAG TPA: hypothetical protein ENI73_09890 [Spirochaetes bacterium]|nr:hypothetical protein [Spirochaetota bacterium]
MANRIRFYLDQNVAYAIAEGLRRRDVDTLTAQEVGKCGASDEEQIVFATSKTRVLFTHDEDFLKLHSAGYLHSGLVYIKQGASIGNMIRGLMMIYDMFSAEEMDNHLEFLIG